MKTICECLLKLMTLGNVVCLIECCTCTCITLFVLCCSNSKFKNSVCFSSGSCNKMCVSFFFQMVTVNSLQAIYKLLCANPDTTTLSKQPNAQLINVRRKSTNCYNLSTFYLAINTVRICLVKELLSSVQNLVSKVNLFALESF